VSLGFVSIGLGAILLGLSEANSWGWTAPPTLGLFALGLVLLALWTRRELASKEPLIDVRMFLIPTFSLSMAIVAGLVIVQFGRLVFVPLELVTLHGMNALEVGLILTPAAFGSALCSPFAGQVADRIGSRLPVMAGLIMIGIGSFFLANVHADTPPWTLGIWVGCQGVGSGLALTPNTVAGMNTLPQRLLARGAAVRSTTRQVSASFGVAALTALVLFQSGQLVPGATIGGSVLQEAYNSVFVASVWILAACMVLALFLPNAERTREFQAARNEEFRTLTSTEPTREG
jgi:MFS family permease